MNRFWWLLGLAVFWVCVGGGFILYTSAARPDGTLDEAIQELRRMKIERDLVSEESPQATEEFFRKSEEQLRAMEEEKEKTAKEGRKAQFPDSLIDEHRQRMMSARERSGERGKARVESMLQADLKRYREEFEKIYDIPHTTLSPEEIEKEWVKDLWYQVDYQKHLREFPDSNGNLLLEIRGRVIDQDGNPVPEAEITFMTGVLKGRTSSRVETITVKTNGKGVYHVENKHGDDLGLQKIAAVGYRYFPESQPIRSFMGQAFHGTLDMQRIRRGENAPGNYVEFILWKEVGRTEKVVVRGARKESMGLFGVGGFKLEIGDNTQVCAYAFDLFKDWCDWVSINAISRIDERKRQEIRLEGDKNPFYQTKLSTKGDVLPDPKEYEGKGDFVAQIFASPIQPTSLDEPRQAILRITAIEGGVAANPQKSFLAPEEGYQPFMEFPVDLSANAVRVLFFLKSRGGQVYSRMMAKIDAFGKRNDATGEWNSYKVNIQFSGIISPTGSRVLEPEGPVYTQEETLSFSTRDWKLVEK